MSLEIRKEITIKGATLSEDPILYFDNIGPATSLAAITVDSFGGGTSGDMIFQTAQSGVLTEVMRIGQLGQVAIGTSSIDTSAVFQVDSLNRGFLPPRTPDPGTNIVTPATGLMAYDSTDNELQYYNGTSWVSLAGGSAFLPLAGGTMSGDIDMDGNAIHISTGDKIQVDGNGAIEISSDKGVICRAGATAGTLINTQAFEYTNGNSEKIILNPANIGGIARITASDDGTVFAGSIGWPLSLSAATQWNLPDASGTIALQDSSGIYGGSGILPSSVAITMGGNNIEMQGTGDFFTTNADAGWGIGATPTSAFQMYQVATTHSTAHYIIQQKTDVSSNVIAQRILSTSTKTGSATLYGINTVLSGTHALGTHVGMHISVTDALNNYGLIIEDGSVGIGTTTPTEKLHVSGSIRIVDGSEGVGKVLTSDVNGVAAWQMPSGGVSNEYIALLTQIGTSAPTESVLNDTLTGGTWSYSSVGHYHYTKVGAFTNVDKVEVRIEANQLLFMSMTNSAFNMMSASRLNEDTILVKTANVGFVGGVAAHLSDPTLAGQITDFLVDGILSNTPITIRVWS